MLVNAIFLGGFAMKKKILSLVRIKVLKCLVSTNNCITFAVYGSNDIERNAEWDDQGAVV